MNSWAHFYLRYNILCDTTASMAHLHSEAPLVDNSWSKTWRVGGAQSNAWLTSICSYCIILASNSQPPKAGAKWNTCRLHAATSDSKFLSSENVSAIKNKVLRWISFYFYLLIHLLFKLILTNTLHMWKKLCLKMPKTSGPNSKC